MAIQMTSEEYEAKYGIKPSVKMTQAEYNAKYGSNKDKRLQNYKDLGIENITGGPPITVGQQQVDILKGGAKGLGRTLVDLPETIIGSLPFAGQALKKGYENITAPVQAKLQPSNLAQKIGGYAELTGELLAPFGAAEKGIQKGAEALRTAKALDLTVDELSKINGSKLETLSKDALKELPTKGGTITSERPDISKIIKPYQEKFGKILTGKTPSENIQIIKKFFTDNFKKTLSLFDKNEKAINENTLRKELTNALNKDKTTTYASEYEKKDVTKKAVDNFIDSVKKGTNKGIEEARNKWYQESKNAKGKLSEANKVLHDAIKNVIKKTLPEESQKLYDEYKKTGAMANDVKEILKAKNVVRSGTSVLKKAAKVGGIVGGISAASYGAYEGAKKLGAPLP